MVNVCNHDCFNCPYPDCIVDDMTAEEYRELRRIERELIRPKSRKELSIAAKKREYREANREKYNAYMREYRRKQRDKARDALVW